MAKAPLLPPGFIEKAEQLIGQADQFAKWTGDQKRKYVARQLAKWIDEKTKLPWYLELVDGPLMAIVFEWIIQVIFDLIQRAKAKKAAEEQEALDKASQAAEEKLRKKREA